MRRTSAWKRSLKQRKRMWKTELQMHHFLSAECDAFKGQSFITATSLDNLWSGGAGSNQHELHLTGTELSPVFCTFFK